MLSATLGLIAERARRLSDQFTFTTCFDSLDNVANGFYPGQLVVLGGYPSAKTSFALNFVHKRLQFANDAIAWYTLADTVHQINFRLLSVAANIPTLNIQAGFLPPDENDSLARVGAGLVQKDFTVKHLTMPTAIALLAHIRGLMGKTPAKYLIVDSLPFINAGTNGAEREHETEWLLKALKQIAIEYNATVLAIAGTAGVFKTGRPQLGDLESTMLNIADTILLTERPFMHIDADENENRVSENDLLIHVVKNRYGGIGTANFFFDANTGIVTDFNNKVPF